MLYEVPKPIASSPSISHGGHLTPDPPIRALNHRHEHKERKAQPALCGLCALKKYYPVAGNTDDTDKLKPQFTRYRACFACPS
ncbi:MAG: hypothetical protein WA102_14035, partial [Candidatus Methanoperedens sp.]